MSDKPILQPGPTHPITIEPAPHRVTVTRDGHAIASSEQALTLREADYPAVQYIPFQDVDASLLKATERTTYCPYKGDANYYSLVIGGDTSENAVWQYSSPHEAVAPIGGHVAFYADRVQISEN
ncbi:MAG: DUF427 domain-containing protein [Candidatus Dormibacteria bacterium]